MEPVTHTSVRSFFPSSAIPHPPFPILSLQVVSPHAPFPVPRSYFSLSARLSHYLLSFFIPTPRLPFHFRLSLFKLAFPSHPSPLQGSLPRTGTREKWRASRCSWSGCQGNIFPCDPANFARSIFRVPTFSSFPLTEILEQRDSSNCLTYSWQVFLLS